LAGIKHLNRLDQVLASGEIAGDCDEGLCLDESEAVIEGCRSNLLLVIENELVTPDLSRSGVQGVMLNHLIKEFGNQGTPVMRKRVSVDHLQSASQIILCNSVFGVWPVVEIPSIRWQSSGQGQTHTAIARQIVEHVFRGPST